MGPFDIHGIEADKGLGEHVQHYFAGFHGLAGDKGQRRGRSQAVNSFVGEYPDRPGIRRIDHAESDAERSLQLCLELFDLYFCDLHNSPSRLLRASFQVYPSVL